MRAIEFTGRFKRDYRAAKRQGRDLSIIKDALEIIASKEPLPQRFRDHGLNAPYADHRECHLAADWLLIYRIDENRDVVTATRLGSHSDLFD